MKIVFHEKYYNSNYANDPAAASGRIEPIMNVLSQNTQDYEIIEPEPALEEDILRAHTNAHLARIKQVPLRFELAALAAGGAILSAEQALQGFPSFAVIRPPGHHASADSCWGFCFFNNISISLLKLYSKQKIKTAFVLDFDLHTGDGNINILLNRNDGFEVDILNPGSFSPKDYLIEVEEYMKNLHDIDIFVASAGFDEYEKDWGGKLSTQDYNKLGRLMKEYSEKLCKGRRYALLEGGYYHKDFGINVDSFCQGFK